MDYEHTIMTLFYDANLTVRWIFFVPFESDMLFVESMHG